MVSGTTDAHLNARPGIRQRLREAKQRLQESEERNKAAIKYIMVLENVCKTVLRFAAEQHDEMKLVWSPALEAPQEAMAQICMAVAPVCGPVENLEMNPTLMALLTSSTPEDPSEVEIDPESPSDQPGLRYTTDTR